MSVWTTVLFLWARARISESERVPTGPYQGRWFVLVCVFLSSWVSLAFDFSILVPQVITPFICISLISGKIEYLFHMFIVHLGIAYSFPLFLC